MHSRIGGGVAVNVRRSPGEDRNISGDVPNTTDRRPENFVMKNIFTLIAFTFLLISCSHGKTQYFPSGVNSSNAAEVFIIRSDNLFGWGFSLSVAFDDHVIADLRAGEHVSFLVAPGFHSLGISKPTMTLPFEKGKIYYFLISADYTKFGFELAPIGKAEGKYWVANTKPLP
jgi:hypothetical protein